MDYVLERGGTAAKVGRPKAFIEIAYRRYTKHSRNKAQEIQGAIAPLFETYKHDHPFIGVVLAGIFTGPSLAQLRSNGFGVLYMPFDSIVHAFKAAGIAAYFDENSEDADVQRKVDAWNSLAEKERTKVGAALRKIHAADFAVFVTDLERCLSRAIAWVSVLALHGRAEELANIDSAVQFIERLDESKPGGPFARYEVNVRYTNADEIRGMFTSKPEAIKFLRSLA